NTKAYKLYNPVTREVVINRDVQFIENEAWDGSIEKTVSITPIDPHDDMADDTLEKQ
ncbi:hypothetical protein KI387_010512, partial [Taxus chinensis]